ncbi:helix-turn-helix domain-containing protein [Rheinheimera baltica]|uniref:helix-turn-helix domain-containing protein n=1 Tax=Rheinheimera baltica TaxID=67576 RepID=UPI00273D4424|nr:helix-turn-helix transcriptional regulator [Rheinheimera baltica]
MSQLEPMVRSLEHMTTVDALPMFFHQIQQKFGYTFCGVILWRAQRSPLILSAADQADFKRLATADGLQPFCQSRCTPMSSAASTFAQPLVESKDALIIPVRGMGTDSGALLIGLHADQTELAKQIGWYWTIIANYVVETIYRIAALATPDEEISLTSREKACLIWAAKGKTSWEISQILAISERTVNFHLGNCISKTNSNNRQQAISRCLAAGCINL